MLQLLENTKAVLLVGGLGTRLRSVLPDTPKPLASLDGSPFLSLLLRQLWHQGFRRLVMCTGHGADRVETEFGDGKKWHVMIEYSREPAPLGTGGAVRFARHYLNESSDFLVMNGDSFVEADFRELILFHREHNALVTMAVIPVEDASRFGTVQVDASSRVRSFSEKTGTPVPGLINAGLYAFSNALFEYIPEGPISLEQDVFPQLIGHGMYALKQRGIFIDIGTPEDYARAQILGNRLYQAAIL